MTSDHLINQPRIIYSILFYTLCMTIIILTKPNPVFDPISQKPRAFGLGSDKSLFTLGTATVMISLASFYIFTFIDIVCANKT